MYFLYLFAFSFQDGYGSGVGRAFVRARSPLSEVKGITAVEERLGPLVQEMFVLRRGCKQIQPTRVLASGFTCLNTVDRPLPEGEDLIAEKTAAYYTQLN